VQKIQTTFMQVVQMERARIAKINVIPKITNDNEIKSFPTASK